MGLDGLHFRLPSLHERILHLLGVGVDHLALDSRRI